MRSWYLVKFFFKISYQHLRPFYMKVPRGNRQLHMEPTKRSKSPTETRFCESRQMVNFQLRLGPDIILDVRSLRYVGLGKKGDNWWWCRSW